MYPTVCDVEYKFNTASNYLFWHSGMAMKPRELLRALMARDGDNPNSLARKLRGKVTQPQIHKFIAGTAKEPRRTTLQPLADHFDVPIEAFYDEVAADAAARRLLADDKRPAKSRLRAVPDAHSMGTDDLTIPQYDAGGAMGSGLVLEAKPPGLIKSWRVDHEWLRLNVRQYTGLKNLCIVTGFGPSMRGMFNPGDPLLCDCGVTTVETDAVYFFRVGEAGFIKMLQRIPTADGLLIRVKSKNPDWEPFDITPKMMDQFQVFGKILTVWKSEQL